MASPGYLTLEDGSRFPRPALDSDEHHSPAHTLIHRGVEHLTREDIMWLAACADAYGYLTTTPAAGRTKLSMIRRALSDGGLNGHAPQPVRGRIGRPLSLPAESSSVRLGARPPARARGCG